MITAAALENLGIYTLQTTAVIAVASALPGLLRLDNGGVRYAYWRLIALLCAVLPWIAPYQRLVPASSADVTATVGTVTLAAASSAPAVSAYWTPVVVTVLALGVLLRLSWLAIGLGRLRRLRRSVSAAPTAVVDADLQRALGTRADVRFTAAVNQPVTFGLRRPMILLPETLREESSEIRRAVVAHELVHVKRRDWTWLILEEAAVCLFWFHPAMWWLASRIQLAREEVVDEFAILVTGRRKAYIEALLTFADSTSVLPIAAFARRRHLFRRIALVSKEDVMSSRRIVASCAAMALIVGMGSWYTVSALPMRAVPQSASDQQTGPGPLERSARPITPENPIPRRVQYTAPMLPDGLEARGVVTVALTLDALGRVAEARATGLSIRAATFNMSLTGDNINGQVDSVSRGATPPTYAPQMRDAATTFTAAALAAVRQWRYDPPAEAPLTFTVSVPLGVVQEEMFFKPANAASPQVMVVKPRRGGEPEVTVMTRTGAPQTGSISVSGDGALRVGGTMQAPIKIRDVKPVYPPIARAAGVTGVVIVEVRIGADGRVEEGHVLRSIPLLDEAALDAVRQWEFTPTMMNGQAVPIIMTVTVNFTIP